MEKKVDFDGYKKMVRERLLEKNPKNADVLIGKYTEEELKEFFDGGLSPEAAATGMSMGLL